jgi:hypothetical protein
MAAVRRKDVVSTTDDEAGEDAPLSPTPRMNARQRRLHGHQGHGEGWNKITNYDPNKKYIWANTQDKNQGVAYYESIGYRAEVKSEGGVSAPYARKLREGEEILVRDMLLMSMSKEEAQEIEQFGDDGDTGLELARKLELKMTGGKDPRFTDRRALKPSGNFNRNHFGFAPWRSNEEQQ